MLTSKAEVEVYVVKEKEVKNPQNQRNLWMAPLHCDDVSVS